jgi:hypothetical protein
MQPPPSNSARRRRCGLLAILALAFAYALVMQSLGWAQTSNYALVRALSRGTPVMDRYHWETRDESYYRGHYYSVKAPALAFLTLPLYEALHALDAESASRWAARSAREHRSFRWYRAGAPNGLYGDDLQRATRVRSAIERETPLVWALGLLGVVLPALVLLLLVRACAERIQPGYGTAAAVTLGLGTLVMPFATLFFSHVLSAMLAFAAFALLWREREGPPRLALLTAAGLLSGLAITAEYPLAIAGAVLGLYALARREVVRRGLAYAAGVCAGIAPLLLYNLWAFGSLTHFSYANAVKVQGMSGHAALGLNDGGFFGIGLPSARVAFELLFSSKGLLTLSPVLAVAVAGTVILYRRGRRAEALVIGGVALSYLLYNSGYYLPFGGGSPGPRFLIPILPFVAVPLAIAYRRLPALTLALAVPSVLMMAVATTTMPMIGNGDTGYWAHLASLAGFQHTVATIFGAGNGWLALTPFLAVVVGAVALAALATGPVQPHRSGVHATLALLAWGCLATLAPKLPENGAGSNHELLPLVGVAAAASLLISVGAIRELRPRTLGQLSRRREAQRGGATS